jgi:hypothetical protein
MKRAIIGTILLSAVACAAQQSFKLTPSDGSFEVSFPSEPHHQEHTSDSGPIHVEAHSYSFETSASKFVLSYVILTPSPVDLKASDALDSAIGGTLDNVKGKLLAEQSLTMKGKPAKTGIIAVGENTIIDGRFVYVKPRVYQLLVLHRKGVIPPFQRKRLTNTPVREAGSVLKCPGDRKNRVVSAQATYPCGSSAVGGRVCEQRYAPG